MRSRQRNPGSRFGAQIFEGESARTLVAKDGVGKSVRSVLHLHGIIENCSIGSEQVLVSVVIEIKSAGSPARQAAGEGSQLRLHGNIFKLAAAYTFVERKSVAKHRRVEDIRLAVVIEIAEIGAHSSHRLTAVGKRRPCDH